MGYSFISVVGEGVYRLRATRCREAGGGKGARENRLPQVWNRSATGPHEAGAAGQ